MIRSIGKCLMHMKINEKKYFGLRMLVTRFDIFGIMIFVVLSKH